MQQANSIKNTTNDIEKINKINIKLCSIEKKISLLVKQEYEKIQKMVQSNANNISDWELEIIVEYYDDNYNAPKI
ncbi:hypothetical protein MLC52_05410 [Sulfurimonas sp. NW15]|uniref:hypothetical protein n=1 Tax=Sulfurimonas sp. NW15 TaxID=2922729 RepID=UPI003DA7DBC6